MSPVSTTQRSEESRLGETGRDFTEVRSQRSEIRGQALNPQLSTLNTFLEEQGVARGTVAHMPAEAVSELAHHPTVLKNAERLMRDARVRENLALIRQRKMKAIGDRMEQCWADGIGEKVATIDPEFDVMMRMSYGPDYLRDPEKRRFVFKKFPFLRVRCVARALTLRVNGRRSDVGCQRSESDFGLPTSDVCNRERSGGHAAAGDPSRRRGDVTTPRDCLRHETAGAALSISEARKSEVRSQRSEVSPDVRTEAESQRSEIRSQISGVGNLISDLRSPTSGARPKGAA